MRPLVTSRRTVLKLAGIFGGAIIVGDTLRMGPAYAVDETAREPRSFKAAFVTDTHIDVVPGIADTNLSAVFADIETQGADFVVNAGDVTNFGSELEFENYLALVPAALLPRIYHTAGNHEVRWDPTGRQEYQETFGVGPKSFDFGGVHFVILEPAHQLQEAAYLGKDQLEWLDSDLKKSSSPHTPTVILQHFPMGEQNYYVNDADQFFETVKPYSVRAIFAGHVHRTDVLDVNGIISVTGKAVKNEPGYYTLERIVDDSQDVLEISFVQLPRAGSPILRNVQPLATIDLSDHATAKKQAPRSLNAELRDGTITVAGLLGPNSGTISAQAQVWEQGAYARRSPGVWTTLTVVGADLSGTVDGSVLLPGHHRLRVRLIADDGGTWEETLELEKPGGAVAERSTLQLDGGVQGGLVTADGYVIATTDMGQVSALTVSANSIDKAWSVTVGPVFRQPAVAADGKTIYVPSADHYLHALRAGDGSELWATDLGGPSLAAPLVTEVDGEIRIVIVALNQAYCLDANGRTIWAVEIPVQSCGKPACDGEMVVIGAGDGRAYGLDARTGVTAWSFDTTTRTDDYRRLIYGPWTSFVTPAGNGLMLVATVTTLHALNATTGLQAWSLPGSHMYTPQLVVGEKVLAIAERGGTTLVDAATGAVNWTGNLVPVSLDAGPVLRGDDAFLVGFSGMLSKVNLGSGVVTQLRQVTKAQFYSTPVLAVDDTVLVVAGQDGVVHSLDISQA